MIDLTLAPPWGQFRLCPALLWASGGSIGALWDHTLDSTLAYEADCGSLWCQFGITLGRVGVALTSLWCHFAHLGVALGSLWDDFWIILGSLCLCLAYEGPFPKTFISLHRSSPFHFPPLPPHPKTQISLHRSALFHCPTSPSTSKYINYYQHIVTSIVTS